MNPLDGIPYLFWGIASALRVWHLLYRRWMGMHRKDPLVRTPAAYSYVAPSQACKAIEQY